METPYPQLDLSKLRVFPLERRRSLTTVEGILIPPESKVRYLDLPTQKQVEFCAKKIKEARARNANVILMYGAHLLRNGAAIILDQLMAKKWITHLATNGAGSIHDWEYAWLGRSTESVRENVSTGTFGTWDETGKNILLSLLAGGLQGFGYGQSLGKFIIEDGTTLPTLEELEDKIVKNPSDPLTSARADVIHALKSGLVMPGPVRIQHPWKEASIFAAAYRNKVPLTVHPGIGYDIITNHPLFNGSVVGRTSATDFRAFCKAVDGLDQGVLLSIGSAIMAPQVFEKSLSCVHNFRFQEKKPIVADHSLFIVDLQEGGNWDWTKGEPPKTNPAYYLRFCKSFARMGGEMHYLCCDNATFVHYLYHLLK